MNWGQGITVVISLFMLFILSMLYRATQVDSDLYAPDYYQQELGYQNRIDAMSNTKESNITLEIKIMDGAVELVFSDEFNPDGAVGTVNFYKPDNAAFDKILALNLSSNKQIVKTKDFAKGLYQIKLMWTQNGKDYFIEKNISLK